MKQRLNVYISFELDTANCSNLAISPEHNNVGYLW